MSHVGHTEPSSVAEVLDIDREARRLAKEYVK
jgi:hypothetical protein